MPRRRSSAHRSGSIPVSARTRVDLPWSTCPAVATTAHRHSPGPAATHARIVGVGSAGTQRRSSRSRPCSHPAEHRRARRCAAARRTARAALSAHDSQFDARVRRRRRRRPRDGTTSAAAVGRARRAAARRARAAAPGRRAARPRSGCRAPRRVASSAARVSLSTRRARASGCRRSRSHQVGVAEQQPGLRAAEQLVAAGGDQRGAGAQGAWRASGSSGSSGSGASSPEPMSATTGTPSVASSLHRYRRGEAGDPKFDGCTLSTKPVRGPIAAA